MKAEKVLEILACPRCRGEVLIEKAKAKITCKQCWARYRFEGEVPVMLPEEGVEIHREGAPQANVYAPGSMELIERQKGGLVLDDGAGFQKQPFPHVVQLEMYLSPSTDVVADALYLPFRGGAFDAVISEAVIEHVTDPFLYASEIHRVLKDGGEVRIDAPFLHPYHAVPHHYFNMTRSGLELLLSAFEKIQSGVGPHQEPWVVLRDVLGIYAASLDDQEFREKFLDMSVGDLLKILQEQKELAPLRNLRPEMVEYISAGVYFHGLKGKGTRSEEAERPAVSVVVVGGDGGEGLAECLGGLTEVRYPKDRLEVILADGDGEDGVDPAVLKRFPRVHTVRKPAGSGTAEARMTAAREAKGKYIALLDGGCRVGPNWIEGLLDPMDPSKKVVCTSSRILGSDGKTVEAVPGEMDFLGHPIDEEDDGPAEGAPPPVGPTLFPLGAAMMIEREVLFGVGGFDAAYVDSLDDLDLGWRLWVLGHEVHHAPAAPVRRVDPEDEVDPARRALLVERNALRSIYKNYDDENLRRILPVAILLTLERGWGHSRISAARYRFDSPEDDDSESESLSKVHAAHLLAVDEFLRDLDRVHEQRRRVQRKRVRPDREILPLLKPPAKGMRAYRETLERLCRAFEIQVPLVGGKEGSR